MCRPRPHHFVFVRVATELIELWSSINLNEEPFLS